MTKTLNITVEGAEPCTDSGIYKLTFNSGRFYIGKSIHIKERWKQHFDKFKKGKAAENMQQEFDEYGYPECKILVNCHADHIDIMECYLIQYYAREYKHLMLNTTYADAISDEEFKTFENNSELILYSTHVHIKIIEYLKKYALENLKNIEELTIEISDLKKHGIVLPDELEDIEVSMQVNKAIIENLRFENKMLQERLDNYLKLSWWKRLFH